MIKLLAVVVALAGCTACNTNKSKTNTSPQGYDFNDPVRYKMPEKLLEVSGIAFRNGNADTVYAQQDEDGRVFHFHLGDDKVAETRFAKKGDYEDVAICNNWVIMLKSNGTLYTFPLSETANENTDSAQEYKQVLPGGEYEGLYADEEQHIVSVLCKQCDDDKPTKRVSVYTLTLQADGSLQSRGSAVIDVKQIEQLTGDDKVRFEPAALAKNPVTHQWFILSSINKLLLTANENWQVTAAIPLSRKTFLQPEGIAFDKQGNLYISNEGDELTNGNILFFKYTKP